ncbi:hypothetical protein GQX73_g8880 [Xylaria multiplex]|uniref:RING-type domain-containing protein n=1 Tax=Xylaria multiplex TaxID=323545 RepID=A0A7C8ILU9_9PEZI|nr:hypothetical protein GQX73_g8880 [Xylaria multiplex]
MGRVGMARIAGIGIKKASDDIPPVEKKITRAISGALAHFEEGAGVTEVLFTSDLSAVQLIGLPHDSTPTSVLHLLQSRGLDTSVVSHIRVVRTEISSEARAEAKARHFAESVVAKFGRQRTSQQGPGVTAVPIPVNAFPSSSSSSLRVDCKKVHCSWHKPSKTVWLNFGSEEVAKRVSERFKKGEYKILKQMAHPSDPTRGEGIFNTKAWTICLTGVASDATRSDISNAVWRKWDTPRGIELGTPTYTADFETCATKIQSLFTAVGPLEWWEFTQDTTGKRMKASARFLSEEDAKDAVALHDSPLPFHKTAKLTVQLVYCARFKVSSLIYDAVERQIKGHIPKWKMQYVHFTAYEQSQPPKWYRTVKLEGENSKTVAEAKNVISGIFAGIVAKEGSSNLWHPSLRSNGEISSKLTQLQQQTGVVILPNKAKSQLRLFGPLEGCEWVQARISEILNDQRPANFTIELDEEKFLWARLGGYKRLAVELGPESVSLDVVSKPKRIIITGTETKYNVALSIINGKARANSKPDPNGQDCSACWTESENPIQTHCGHTYCLDCFENMCLSAPTQESAVEIRCVGDSGSCNMVLDIPQLQEHLSSTAFEELLEQSFASSRECEAEFDWNPQELLTSSPTPSCRAARVCHGDTDSEQTRPAARTSRLLRRADKASPQNPALSAGIGAASDESPSWDGRSKEAEDEEEGGRTGWRSGFHKLIEGSATAFGSILVLGLAGYSYHAYYKSHVLRKMENAFAVGYSSVELAALSRHISPTSPHSNLAAVDFEENDWVPRSEQAIIDSIVDGTIKGQYHLITGEKGTGKTSMLLKAMRRIGGEGVAMLEAHGDPEIFRVRLGKALDFEFHEDYIGSLFSFKGPRDTTALLDIERAFNKMEKIALRRKEQVGKPLVLIITGAHLVRDDSDGQDLLELIQQRAELWAGSNLVTIIFVSDDYWTLERLMWQATRLRVTTVHDVPRNTALEALKAFRSRNYNEDVPSSILEQVYDKVGGRLSFLSRVAKSEDMIKASNAICEREKRWLLSHYWILGEDLDPGGETQQDLSSAAMLLAKKLVDKEKAMRIAGTYDGRLPQIPIHEAQQIMTNAAWIKEHEHNNIFTINSDGMVQADSVAMQHAMREICEREGFDEHLQATLDRLDEIESLQRTREITLKDLQEKGVYQANVSNGIISIKLGSVKTEEDSK